MRQYSTVAPRVIKTVAELRNWRLERLKNSQSVGMVPTMGALHQGHLNLVSKSLKENHSTIVSIFVNPSQFAPGEDLDNYPRTLDTDLASLQDISEGKEITVFLPSVSEMYPSGITIEREQQQGAFVEVKGLSEQLEGAIRPQFFRGVATIVTKLLNAAGPDYAYFGQKDVQQSIVVKRMVKDLLMPTEIVVVPTAREENGLAMSSRNEYLTTDSRLKASILYKALSNGENAYKTHCAAGESSVQRSVIVGPIVNTLQQSGSDFPVEVEYIALSDKESLQELDQVTPGKGAVISGAVRVPNKTGSTTRIIDNIILT